jgi:hypothetical protein
MVSFGRQPYQPYLFYWAPTTTCLLKNSNVLTLIALQLVVSGLAVTATLTVARRVSTVYRP